MGLFDYVQCEMPLPDGFDPAGLEWQTKCFDDVGMGCYMRTFVLRADGTFHCDGEDLSDFHGDVCFYGSNWGGVCGPIFCTSDDKPPLSKTYHIRMTNGVLQSITGGDDGSFENQRQVMRRAFDAECKKLRDVPPIT